MRRRWAWTEKVALGAAIVLLVAGAVLLRVALLRTVSHRVVYDAESLLSPDQQRRIERQHRALRLDHDLDYRVELTRDVDDIDAYAHRRFAELAVGAASESKRGLLLVVDTGGDVLRLEVSRSLEGVFTDAFVAYLEQRQMVPFFRAERIADGVLAATEMIVTHAQQAQANAGWEGLNAAGSAGGGARARLGEGPDGSFRVGPDVAAGETPEATLAAYLDAMTARNGRPDLDLYSSHTRVFLAQWVVTPAQMDNVARAYRRCHPEAARVDETGTRAVIRYPVDERACAPALFVMEDGRWRLDLLTASAAIRFGRDNAWRFAPGAEHPYAFAFRDWKLDRHGSPLAH